MSLVLPFFVLLKKSNIQKHWCFWLHPVFMFRLITDKNKQQNCALIVLLCRLLCAGALDESLLVHLLHQKHKVGPNLAHVRYSLCPLPF